MRRISGVLLCAAFVAGLVTVTGQAQSASYQLVPNWPKMPPGMFLGTQSPFPDPATREAQAAARRAQGQQQGQQQGGQGQRPAGPGPTFGTGIAGISIDDNDNIYMINRGAQTVLVFDRDGNFVRGGAEKDQNANPIAGGWVHEGEVDWQGNFWLVERDNHRILKLNPTLDKVLMQLGTTGQRGNDETHFDLVSGIVPMHNGNLVVTDGYGNNRVVMYSPDGKFIKQVAKGRGGPDDSGAGPGEWDLPHKGAVDANDNLYLVDRENKRVQVFDKNLNHLREIKNDWNPWDIGISRKGNDGFAYIADHYLERVHKISLADGKILATWGTQGRGPGQFDWVHGIVVDSQGAVYAADTYGQRVQKFVPTGATPSASR